MALEDVSDPAAIQAAIDEAKRLGPDAFERRYGYGSARRYAVEAEGERYDVRTVLGFAHGYQFPNLDPLSSDELLVDEFIIRKLQSLGLRVVDLTAIITKSGRMFGDIPGHPAPYQFDDRAALAAAGIHKPIQAGISFSKYDGADSIVVSGGYEDDEDDGDILIYTGHGGQDQSSKRQVADQEFTHGNFALAKSCIDGLPVRVTRGFNGDPRYSPKKGYRYDGLFSVQRYWHEIGRSGFRIWRYSLSQSSGYTPKPDESVLANLLVATNRTTFTTQRIIRNNAVSRRVKELYKHRCQICAIQLGTPSGFYAEGAHLRPLGRPHNGADVFENILCLCPNDHVLLDTGSIYIRDDFILAWSSTQRTFGELATAPSHYIDQMAIRYHREHIAILPGSTGSG